MIKATMAALSAIQSPREIAARRGKKVSEIIGRRGGGEAKAERNA
jgi:small subunit ribosomal protein S5